MKFWDQHKTITNYYEAITKTVCKKYDLTQMEYSILMFLYNNPKYATAADIVKIRKSTKSHVSVSLKHLEEKGLITRIQSTENKKHVEIILREGASPIIEEGLQAQKVFGKVVFKGFSKEEIEMCNEMFLRICNNAEEELKFLNKTE